MNQSFGPTIDKALKLLNEPSNEIYKIDLSGFLVSLTAASTLATALCSNTTMNDLDISFTGLSSNGLESFSNALRRNKHLTYLRIDGNPSATLGYVSLFKTIQIQNTTLSKISIDVPNKVVDQFLNMMNTNTTIRCIALYPESTITDENAVKICQCIETHRFLLEFSIAGPFNVAKIDAIVSIIRNNKRLIHFTCHDFTPMQRNTIAKALKCNFTLLEIDVPERIRKRILRRNKSLQWKNVHAIILDICIAMWPLQLPNYVLLEIIDWLPHYYVAVSHLKKIRLIENVNRSIRNLIDQREFKKL